MANVLLLHNTIKITSKRVTNMKKKGKKLFKSVALISALILVAPLSYIVGYSIGLYQNSKAPSANYTKPEETLKIMSFNICSWSFDGKDLETRAEGIAKTIVDNSIDSIGLQEATPYWMNMLNAELSDKYGCVCVGSNTATDYTKSEDNEDEFTSIFYLKNKFNVIDSGWFWLSETPDTPSYGWGSAYRRICTWVVLENKETKSCYVHINAHFDNESSEARKNSIQMVLDKAEAFGDLPVVFTGDLNFVEQSLGYKDITSDVLKDTKTSAIKTIDSQTYHGGTPKDFEEYVLDYILINDKFSATNYNVIKKKYKSRYISDHYPVIAEITIK